MKRYIFLTTTVRNVGGAQLYISRKKEWLESLGWVVDVYFYNEGDVKIQGLKKYQSNCIKELSLPHYVLNTTCLNKIADKLRSVSKEIYTIIESHTINLTLIGEEIAKIINAKHLAYWLSESFPAECLRYKNFFERKLEDNSLFGITDRSIPDFLGYNNLTKNRGLLAVGCFQSIVENIEFPFINNIKPVSYNILCLGRLDKPYVEYMITKIIVFVRKYINKDFNLIFVGSSADISIETRIKDRISVLSNVNSYFLGYMFPIPKQLLQIADVVISSSGSALVAYRENIKTITIDANDWEPLGVLGFTTKNVLFRENEPKQKLEDLLENILIENKYTIKNKKYDIPIVDNLDYTQHQKVIDLVINSKCYDISYSKTLKEKILYLLSFMCGTKVLIKIFSMKTK